MPAKNVRECRPRSKCPSDHGRGGRGRASTFSGRPVRQRRKGKPATGRKSIRTGYRRPARKQVNLAIGRRAKRDFTICPSPLGASLASGRSRRGKLSQYVLWANWRWTGFVTDKVAIEARRNGPGHALPRKRPAPRTTPTDRRRPPELTLRRPARCTSSRCKPILRPRTAVTIYEADFADVAREYRGPWKCGGGRPPNALIVCQRRDAGQAVALHPAAAHAARSPERPYPFRGGEVEAAASPRGPTGPLHHHQI